MARRRVPGVVHLHDHVDFEVRRSGGGLASTGVYMIRLDMTMPTFAEGAPAYVIFSTLTAPTGSEFAARTYVENNLVAPLCSDGVDNDRDGFTDFAGGDPGCSSATDDSEKDVSLACDDGIDNDGDGNIDFRAVDFGAAGLFASRDQECASPTDISGEAVLAPVPSISGPGAVLLVALLLGGCVRWANGRSA